MVASIGGGCFLYGDCVYGVLGFLVGGLTGGLVFVYAGVIRLEQGVLTLRFGSFEMAVQGSRVSGSRFDFVSRWTVAAIAAIMTFAVMGAFTLAQSVGEALGGVAMCAVVSAVLVFADWVYGE